MTTRHEKIVLSLDGGDFTSGMARAAAATLLLSRELKGLSGQSVATARVSQTIARDTDRIAKSANTADKSINQLTGRLRLFADAAAILGPGLAPIGAVAVPAVIGLANQLGVAALAGGTAILAFQGVGDALKAVNEAGLAPTAENLEAARLAMANLAPAAQDMVGKLRELSPVLTGIRNTAAEGLMPGVIELLDDLETRVPEIERSVGNMSATLGGLLADAGDSFASDRYTDFFDYLATDAPQTLVALGRTVGDLTHGMTELFQAFDPLNDDFSGWLANAADSFDRWASGLDQTDGFREFVAYIRETGPQVADTFGSLANAVVQIGQAAAPLGGPVLAGLERVFDVIGNIADSDLGTPLLAAVGSMALLTRATKGYQAVAKTAFATNTASAMSTYVSNLLSVTSAQERATRAAGDLAPAQRGVGDSFGRLEKATFAVAGIFALDTAIDALLSNMREALPTTEELTGQLLDLGDSSVKDLGEQFRNLGDDLDFMGSKASAGGDFFDWIPNITGLLPGENAQEQFDRVTEQIERLDQALANIATDGSAERAKAAFADFAEAQGLSAGQQEELLSRLPAYSDALQRAANEAKLAADAGRQGSEGINELGEAMKETAAAATQLEESLKSVSDTLAGRASMRDYEQAIDDAAEALRNAKKAGKDFLLDNKTGFDTNIQAGRDLEIAMDNIASSAVDVASKLKGAERVRVLQRAREDIRSFAKDAGFSEKAIRELVRETYNLDGLKARAEITAETAGAEAALRRITALARKYGLTKETAEALLRDVASGRIKSVQGLINKYGLSRAQAQALLNDLASGKINAIRANLNALDGQRAETLVTNTIRTVRETVNRVSNSVGGALGAFNEDGGIHINGVRAFADGGYGMDGRYYPRVPQIVKGGANILWGEDVTGQEAYISKKPGMEARNIAILNEAASWWGLSLTKRFANGGFPQQQVSAPVPIASGPSVVVNTGPVQTTDVNAAARALEQRLRDAVALSRVP